MAEVRISGDKLLKTIISEFRNSFPYLTLRFFSKEEGKSSNETGASITTLDENQRLSTISAKNAASGAVCIQGDTIVKNFEQAFFDSFGICCQVGYVDQDTKDFASDQRFQEMPFEALNEKMGSLFSTYNDLVSLQSSILEDMEETGSEEINDEHIKSITDVCLKGLSDSERDNVLNIIQNLKNQGMF